MPTIQSSTVIGKIEDGSDITQDVDVLVWWRDVENEDKLVFLSRQFLAIPAASATAERVFSFAGLTLSDLRKSLLESTLEAIMWGQTKIPFLKVFPYLLMFITVDWSDSKFDSACVRVSSDWLRV